MRSFFDDEAPDEGAEGAGWPRRSGGFRSRSKAKIVDLGDLFDSGDIAWGAGAPEESLIEAPGGAWAPKRSEAAPEEEFEGLDDTRRRPRLRGAPRDERSLKAEAVAMLARRDYSKKELAQKLARKFPARRDEIEGVLTELEKLGFLSNSRFAERFVRERARRYGTGRLRQELRRRGLDSDEIEGALEGVEEPEEERAWRIWERKFSGPPEDERERGRQVRFLAARGFSYSVIRQVFDRAKREAEESED